VIAGLEGTETVVMNPNDDVREGALVRTEAPKAEAGAPKK
jgi:hypothetical protein